MALNRSDKSRILRRYFPGMTRNSEMSTEPRQPPYPRKTIGPLPSLDRSYPCNIHGSNPLYD